MLVQIPRRPDATAFCGELLKVPGPAWFWWRPDAEWPEWDILIQCPHGHWATLSPAKHHVATDGTVSPSLFFQGLCGAPGSGVEDWHVHGRLESWTPADTARLGKVVLAR